MKTLARYITEKANFLVKKHLHHSNDIDDKIIDILNVYLSDYTASWNNVYIENNKWAGIRLSDNCIRQYDDVEYSYWNKIKDNLMNELKEITDNLDYSCSLIMNDNIMIKDKKTQKTMIHIAYINSSNCIRVAVNKTLVKDENIV